MSFFSNFFLVSLIVLRHYHIRFEVPRCKNEHFYLFILVKFWLLSNFSAFRAICPFFHLEGPSISLGVTPSASNEINIMPPLLPIFLEWLLRQKNGYLTCKLCFCGQMPIFLRGTAIYFSLKLFLYWWSNIHKEIDGPFRWKNGHMALKALKSLKSQNLTNINK